MGKSEKTIIAYKGFEKDWTCRGFQFEVGKSYEHDGAVIACESGFHACESPFDVWSYYGPFESKFAMVELVGKTARHGDDTKIAAANITIKAELTMPDFIKAGIDWLIEKTKGSGDFAKIGSSGYSAKIGSSGNSAQIGSSGDFAKIGSSGYSAQIGSSGDSAKIGSSGDSAQIGSSGDFAQIGSSGDFAKIGSSGNSAQIGSSGDSAQIGSSGNSAQIDATGKNSVVASAGNGTWVKGADGLHVAIAEFDNKGQPIGFAVGQIGKEGLKPDTWYKASGGKLVEAA